MATVQTRPFSRNYSGLVEQSVLAGCIILLCVVSHECMVRKRRGKHHRGEPLGSVESWQFGYLFQGRSWAKRPSPPYPIRWPLSWVKEVIQFPEAKLGELRGVDATLYCRFIRGCFWFVALHTFTTTVILLPIHLKFSDGEGIPSKSMNRALISALINSSENGLRFLWIHLVLMLWVTLTWLYNLIWISKGAFRFRSQAIQAAKKQTENEQNHMFAPHPHPQHPFQSMPPLEEETKNKSLKLRTVMVSNIPGRMRSEGELKEYFEYYMSRPLVKPAFGLVSSTQPGFVNKMVTYLINRLRRYGFSQSSDDDAKSIIEGKAQEGSKPVIERVVIARKMTELASLLDRREETLRRLEAAHIRLARNTLSAVKEAIEVKEHGPPSKAKRAARRLTGLTHFRPTGVVKTSVDTDIERGLRTSEDDEGPEDRSELLIRTLAPYVDELEVNLGCAERSQIWMRQTFSFIRRLGDHERRANKSPDTSSSQEEKEDRHTVWEALFSLPRATLNPYQPLIYLSALFRGQAVPAIDYYTQKVNLLTARITEQRSRPVKEFEPVSTAFVTFEDPREARRACSYLAVHPDNPLACLVTMAPDYEDLDWVRVMKQTYKAEILKDWVVDVGVWIFTIAWVIPVTLLVALVNINNIATLVPGLQNFLTKHDVIQELIASLLPTLLTSLLILLIPLVLLLIAKKAHTITTLSMLHDRILTRYYKFLVANILVFFCIGVSALESFFTSFKSSLNVLQVVGESFPTAGPFYVGWFIFTTAIHGGIELGLFGLPLIMYPFTKRQVTPRARAVGIRPRTFNYYYWLPNHLLVIILIFVFAVLNPLLMPFALVYFAVQRVVIKNQLLHVYAKNYEGNGQYLLIRLSRYSIDGLILAQVIFLAFLAVIKKEVHVALTAVMIAFTVVVKLVFTRIIRSKFESADIIEAQVVCGVQGILAPDSSKVEKAEKATTEDVADDPTAAGSVSPSSPASPSLARIKTWKMPKGFRFTYKGDDRQKWPAGEHNPIPFEEAAHSYQHGPILGAQPADSMPIPGTAPISHEHDEHSPGSPFNPFDGPDLVTKHEKHSVWDDDARLDRPYDNPYFSRPVQNHMWLPRNPGGLLDLDDTVNVFRALTSDPSHGRLGEWIEGGIALTDLPPSIASTSSISERLSPGSITSRHFNGDEEIELPPVIAERVENIHNEKDVERAEGRSLRRPSIITRRTNSSGVRKRSVSISRPATFSNGMPITPRHRGSSFLSAHSFKPQPSFISQASSPPRRGTSHTDAASQWDLHSQTHFAQFGVVSPSLRTRERTRSATGSTPVTMRDAVLGEVIAEEYHATEENRMKEETQTKRATDTPSTRSWLTKWMFSRDPRNE